MTNIVLDALDECRAELRGALFDTIEAIVQRSDGLVKIFLASRDDQDIVFNLGQYPSIAITADLNGNDILSFVCAETESLIKRGRLLRNSSAREEMNTLIIEKAVSRAEGM
jgi:hypothetical protein